MGDTRPGRLVVRLPNWLGDAVMALPALGVVRSAYPDTFITLAALPSIAPLFEEETAARPDQVLTVDRATETARLRAGSFDAALLLTNSFRTAWSARRAGISSIWGYGAGVRRPLLARAVPRPRDEVHQSQFYLHLVRTLGCDAPEPALPLLRATAGTQARTDRLLQQHDLSRDGAIVGFAPGAAYGHAKRWPPERVAGVILRLTREHNARCVLVGAPADRDAGRAIESQLPRDIKLVNLIGRTDLRLLTGVLSACRAFVSNDSGAMHLAGAVGVPVTAIFGPTKAHVTAPLGEHEVLRRDVFCSPCMLRECPIDHRCMKRITTDDVFASVIRRLDAPAAHSLPAGLRE